LGRREQAEVIEGNKWTRAYSSGRYQFIPYQTSHNPKFSGRRINERDLSGRESKYGRMGGG
jgi:hypothetical protein